MFQDKDPTWTSDMANMKYQLYPSPVRGKTIATELGVEGYMLVEKPKLELSLARPVTTETYRGSSL